MKKLIVLAVLSLACVINAAQMTETYQSYGFRVEDGFVVEYELYTVVGNRGQINKAADAAPDGISKLRIRQIDNNTFAVSYVVRTVLYPSTR